MYLTPSTVNDGGAIGFASLRLRLPRPDLFPDRRVHDGGPYSVLLFRGGGLWNSAAIVVVIRIKNNATKLN